MLCLHSRFTIIRLRSRSFTEWVDGNGLFTCVGPCNMIRESKNEFEDDKMRSQIQTFHLTTLDRLRNLHTIPGHSIVTNVLLVQE